MFSSSIDCGVRRLAVWAFIAPLIGNVVRADEQPPTPAAVVSDQQFAGVLVLTEGGVLQGQISRVGDRYVVSHEGGEINVAASSVAQVCHTLDEAYESRRQSLPKQTADAHAELAEWCLRNVLLSQASQEIAAIRALDARYAKLELLERRLEMITAATPPKSPPNVTQTVAVAASTEPSEQDIEEYRTITGDLPPGVVERFTRKVQPLLVNSCTISGCHRPGGKESFQLDRALLHGLANRRSTMRNLAATLAIINREQPQLSPLLTVPRREHGGMKRPIFGPRQSPQVLQLIEWINQIVPPKQEIADETDAKTEPLPIANDAETGSVAPTELQVKSPSRTPIRRYREPVEQVSFDEQGNAAIHAATKQEAMKLAVERAKANANSPAMRQSTELPITDAAANATDASDQFDGTTLPPLKTPRLQRGVQLQEWQPKDAFDAEIFNRYMQKRTAATASTGPNAQQPGMQQATTQAFPPNSRNGVTSAAPRN